MTGAVYANARPRDAAERRLLTKVRPDFVDRSDDQLDCTLLPIVCLLYWSNYLNRTNYAFAYTSGMRQELGFVGNDFTNTNSCVAISPLTLSLCRVFSAIYCVAQIPHAFFVPRVPSRWYFSVRCDSSSVADLAGHGAVLGYLQRGSGVSALPISTR